MRQYISWASLLPFLAAIFFGLAAISVALLLTPSALFAVVIAIIILSVRHRADLLPYVLGAVVGILLYFGAKIILPEAAIVAPIVLIVGCWWF